VKPRNRPVRANTIGLCRRTSPTAPAFPRISEDEKNESFKLIYNH
jgi:hypothetical protein